MDWSKGFSSAFYMAFVDPVSWRDVERIEITGGSIDRERTGLMHSADVNCVNYPGGMERYVRIYMDARQNGDGAHVALFTGLATTPDDDFDGNRKTNKVQCYSVLKAADDVLLPRGWYAPAGINAGVILSDLLSASPAPVTVADGAPTLRESIVANDDDTNLSMAQKIVKAINWRMRLDGMGIVTIEPQQTDASLVLDPMGNDCVETQITVTHDWYSCPNVFRAINENLTAVARDDSVDSALSTINRGREIWMQDTSCDLAGNESIGDYALRRLREEQENAISAKYTRRFFPSIYPDDLLMLKYPAQGVNGLFRIVSQCFDLGYGAPTSEEVVNV